MTRSLPGVVYAYRHLVGYWQLQACSTSSYGTRGSCPQKRSSRILLYPSYPRYPGTVPGYSVPGYPGTRGYSCLPPLEHHTVNINFVRLFFDRSTSPPFPGSATGRRRARSIRSPRSPHSVHGLPTCVCTHDVGAIAIERAIFVILGALLPGLKRRLYFHDFPLDFLPFFTSTRAILRGF